MAHSHLGCQSPRDYFTEQLLTILVCGALAFVGIQMYRNEMLIHILAPQFHTAVLVGSLAVFVLVALRAIAVWREAGELQPVDGMSCQENHVHTAACNHLPGLPGGDDPNDPTAAEYHGHSHDMSWVFVRMLVLVFPVLLFAGGVPNAGFSAEAQKAMVGNETALNLDPKVLEEMANDPAASLLETKSDETGATVQLIQGAPRPEAPKGFKIRKTTPAGKDPIKDAKDAKYVLIPEGGTAMTFNELNEAAFDAQKRQAYAGQTAILEGRFRRLGDKEFTLFRLKMTCCGADTVPLKVRIVAPQSVNGFADHDWVRVRGVIQFVKAAGSERYTPVLRLADVTDVQSAQFKVEYEF